MAAYYLAVDIGASSGRHILGHMENGKMVLEEIYRFENGMVKKDGELCWEFDRLFKEVVNGLKKCKEIGKIPVSMGVDTWGVDFVLLDKNDNVLGNTVARAWIVSSDFFAFDYSAGFFLLHVKRFLLLFCEDLIPHRQVVQPVCFCVYHVFV